jgi:hypothetical protein
MWVNIQRIITHTLHSGEVLPGFTLPIRQLFAEPTES